MGIEKIKILGGHFGATSNQLNSTASLAHLAHFLGKWAELAVLFS